VAVASWSASVPTAYAGWEINDGAFGELTFEVANRGITLNYNHRYTTYYTAFHTFTEAL
jgi:uncharacterized protein DUF6878